MGDGAAGPAAQLSFRFGLWAWKWTVPMCACHLATTVCAGTRLCLLPETPLFSLGFVFLERFLGAFLASPWIVLIHAFLPTQAVA